MPHLNAHIEERLRHDHIAWLITVRPDGRPHVVPIWFFWQGQTILLCLDPTTQKLRNLRHTPQVMLALDGAGKVGEDVVMVEGTAEVLHEPVVSLLRAYPAFAEKIDAYLQIAHQRGILTQYPDAQALFTTYSQPVRVTPTRLLFW